MWTPSHQCKRVQESSASAIEWVHLQCRRAVRWYSVFRVDSSGANRARPAAYVLSAGTDSLSPSFCICICICICICVCISICICISSAQTRKVWLQRDYDLTILIIWLLFPITTTTTHHHSVLKSLWHLMWCQPIVMGPKHLICDSVFRWGRHTFNNVLSGFIGSFTNGHGLGFRKVCIGDEKKHLPRFTPCM